MIPNVSCLNLSDSYPTLLNRLRQIGKGDPEFSVFAPGRVNLIGEHMDYTGGKSLPFAIDRGVTCDTFLLDRAFLQSEVGLPSQLMRGGKGPLALVSFAPHAAHVEPHMALALHQSDCVPQPEENRNKALGAPYVQGAWSLFHEVTQEIELWNQSEHIPLLSISSSLPAGAGMSSSAAFTLALIRSLEAFSQVLPSPYRSSHHPLSAVVLARLAQKVEHDFAGTPCGLMDQTAILQTPSSPENLISIDFADAGNPQVEIVPLGELFGQYETWVIPSGKAHDLSNGDYSSRRTQCEQAQELLEAALGKPADSLLHAIKLAIPDDESLNQFGDVLPKLPGFCGSSGKLNAFGKRALYVAREYRRVESAIRSLAANQTEQLVTILDAAQDDMAELYEVSCPEIEVLVREFRELRKNWPHPAGRGLTSAPFIGPRMMGGGFGGSLVLFVHRDAQHTLAHEFSRSGGISERYKTATGCEASLIRTCKSAGLRISGKRLKEK